jgi:hypothetical protein
MGDQNVTISYVYLKRKVIPKFKSGGRERAFGASHNSGDYLDWAKAHTLCRRS